MQAAHLTFTGDEYADTLLGIGPYPAASAEAFNKAAVVGSKDAETMRSEPGFPHEFIDFCEEFRVHKRNMARFRVSVKTRYNVRANILSRAITADMGNTEKTWFDRLVELIETSGKDYKEISREAKLGQNYVQQMIKDRKQPSVDKFLSIMNVLGPSKIGYVLTGNEMTEEDQLLVQAASPLPPAAKMAALDFFRQLAASQGKPAPASGSRE